MPRAAAPDLDFLTARLHGRRARIADGPRLDALARRPGVLELARAVAAPAEVVGAEELQRWLRQDLEREVAALVPLVPRAGAALCDWLVAGARLARVKAEFRRLLAAPAPPRHGPLRPVLLGARALAGERPRPFFFEAALDHGYLVELVARLRRLPAEDRLVVAPLLLQDADLFHLRLAARGRFGYGVAPAVLLPFHVSGTLLPRGRFAAMLHAPTLAAVAAAALGRVIDALPPEPVEAAALEARGEDRLARLAARALRRGPLGLGTVIGYLGLRRVEVANLVTLSEALRAGLPEDQVRARMIG